MKLFVTSRFEKRLKVFLRKRPNLSRPVQKTMKDIAKDPFAKHLKTHKLSGILGECYASAISYDYRIVFVHNGESVCFIDIGSHDSVYR